MNMRCDAGAGRMLASSLVVLSAACLGPDVVDDGEDKPSGRLPDRWESIITPVTTTLNDLIVIPGANSWACGDAGTLLRSTDGGKTWTRVEIPTTANMYAVRTLSGGTPWRDYVYAVGSNGTVLLSKDDGSTWSVKRSGTETLRSIDVSIKSDGDVFMAISEDGLLITSGDEMETWQSMRIPQAANLRAIATSFDEAWVAGQAGLVLESKDRGATWKKQETATNSDWHAMTSWGPAIVGAGAVRWRTIINNRWGSSERWTTHASTGLPNMLAIHQDWAVGNKDNGAAAAVHFKDSENMDQYDVEDLGITESLRAVAVSSDGVFAAGTRGTILHRKKDP